MLMLFRFRYVDEIVIGAPEAITRELLTTFNIAIVAHGTVYESNLLMEQYVHLSLSLSLPPPSFPRPLSGPEEIRKKHANDTKLKEAQTDFWSPCSSPPCVCLLHSTVQVHHGG